MRSADTWGLYQFAFNILSRAYLYSFARTPGRLPFQRFDLHLILELALPLRQRELAQMRHLSPEWWAAAVATRKRSHGYPAEGRGTQSVLDLAKSNMGSFFNNLILECELVLLLNARVGGKWYPRIISPLKPLPLHVLSRSDFRWTTRQQGRENRKRILAYVEVFR